MAKCVWCEKGGLFQRTTKEGLCNDCSPKVTEDIEKHTEVIYEKMHVYERATENDAQREAIDALLVSAEHLMVYEEKGLETSSPPAALVVAEYREFRKALEEGESPSSD